MAKRKKTDETTSGGSIVIENIGPIERAVIPYPEEGGVVVLRGRNGQGKTTALEAIEAAVTGKGKLEPRDGTLRGTVEAFGVTIGASKSTTRKGELEVHTLDGKLDVASLVDPGLKDHVAADARRIKALVSLTQAKPDVTAFADLVGGQAEFAELVRPSSTSGDDLIVIADRVKRDFETAAREAEQKAENLSGRAAALATVPEGMDLSASDDASILQAALEERIGEASAVVNATRNAEQVAAQVAAAKAKLDTEEARTIDARLLSAQMRRRETFAQMTADQATVERLRKELAAAEAAHRLSSSAHIAAGDVLAAVTSEHKQLAALLEAANAMIPNAPTSEQREAAVAAVDAARKAVERGALIRQIKANLAEAAEVTAKATDYAKHAETLRKAAKGIDGVLSDVVASAGVALRVQDGRLVLDTSRGETYFADLSHGERWKLALDIAIKAVGRGGVLVIPQDAWEGLDPTNRAAIRAHLTGSGVVAYTAEATDDPNVVAVEMK